MKSDDQSELQGISLESIWEELESLPDPRSIMSENDPQVLARDWTILFDYLESVSKLDQQQLDGLYERDRLIFGTANDNEKIRRQLQILTRIAYKVELLKEKKRFAMLIDDRSHPNDWLWPLEKSGDKFALKGEMVQGYTGFWDSAYSEYIYVKERVDRRHNRNNQE